ncbi:hypothetical protein BDW74DRAFT_143174 [Aspergillus multicolor]|uniref:uncharacterized protein n=1 Tax=Aspergillus multicolor TaxID=41759 RepID=UPI003CCD486A
MLQCRFVVQSRISHCLVNQERGILLDQVLSLKAHKTRLWHALNILKHLLDHRIRVQRYHRKSRNTWCFYSLKPSRNRMSLPNVCFHCVICSVITSKRFLRSGQRHFLIFVVIVTFVIVIIVIRGLGVPCSLPTLGNPLWQV